MSVTDPIANFLTSIRNASRAKKKVVDCPASKLKQNIAQILKKEGYVDNFKVISDNKQGVIRIYLKYVNDRKKTPVITNLKKISKPGCKVYKSSDDIKPVFGGIGVAIISTSKGVMTDKECREAGVGGELLCSIW